MFVCAGLQILRSEREQADSEIDSLTAEKKAIKNILPKILHELAETRDQIQQKHCELQVFDKAIAEIEANYGHIIFSPDIFNGNNSH